MSRKWILATLAAAMVIAGGLYLFGKKNEDNPNRHSTEEASETIDHIKIERFDADLFALQPSASNFSEQVAALKEKYGEQYFDMYTLELLEVHNPAETNKVIAEFLGNKAYHSIYETIEKKYANGMADEEQALNLAFTRFHHFFPQKELPRRVIAQFSAFYGNVAVNDANDYGISLEYYLGADFEDYKWVDGINDYMRPNLRREKIVPDLVLGWLYLSFPETNAGSNHLLDEMIYQGKLMYAAQAILPKDTPASLIMGYTTQQWSWCVENEKQMWNYIKENRHLYTTNRLNISKYINPAPYTAFFPQESPGKTGIWIGWRIVCQYMKNNPDVSMEQLMETTDSQKLLEDSGYNPK